jgi:hypothetical protein
LTTILSKRRGCHSKQHAANKTAVGNAAAHGSVSW